MTKKSLSNTSSASTLPYIFSVSVLILCSAAAVILHVSSEENYDIYYMARLGEEIVRNGRIPTINPFSVVHGMPIQIQQPLFCLFCYFALTRAPWLITAYEIVMLCAHILLVFTLSGQYGTDRRYNLLIAGLAEPVMVLTVSCRPGSFTFIFIALEMLLLTKYKKGGSKRLLWFLPLISFLQINIHAAMWLFDFIYILPFVFFDRIPNSGERIRVWWQENRPVLLMIPFMILAAFLNPQGPKTLLWLFSTDLSIMRQVIGELKPIPIGMNVYFLVFFMYFCFFAVYTAACIRKRETDHKAWYAAAGTLLLAYVFSRNMFLLPIGLCPVIALNHRTEAKPSESRHPERYILACSLIIAGIGMAVTGKRQIACKMPETAVACLKENHPEDVKICSEIDVGSYLNFHGFDTMENTMIESSLKKMNKTEDILLDYFSAVTGSDIDGVFDKYSINCVIACNDPMCTHYSEFVNIRKYCETQGWSVPVVNGDYIMYLKE